MCGCGGGGTATGRGRRHCHGARALCGAAMGDDSDAARDAEAALVVVGVEPHEQLARRRLEDERDARRVAQHPVDVVPPLPHTTTKGTRWESQRAEGPWGSWERLQYLVAVAPQLRRRQPRARLGDAREAVEQVLAHVVRVQVGLGGGRLGRLGRHQRERAARQPLLVDALAHSVLGGEAGLGRGEDDRTVPRRPVERLADRRRRRLRASAAARHGAHHPATVGAEVHRAHGEAVRRVDDWHVEVGAAEGRRGEEEREHGADFRVRSWSSTMLACSEPHLAAQTRCAGALQPVAMMAVRRHAEPRAPPARPAAPVRGLR